MSWNQVRSEGWLAAHKVLASVVAAAVVVVVIVVVIVTSVISTNNTGYAKQRQVVQLYNNYQTALSTCLDKTSISAKVATTEYQQYKDVMTSIISARYTDENGNTTRAGGALGDGQLISMLQENYPTIDKSLWKQLMTTANGCRDEVKGVNGHLQSVAAHFDTWTHQGYLMRSVRNNWPNDELKVQGLDGPLTGREALDFIVEPLTTSRARQALQTHEMPDQSDELFPTGE